MHVRWFSCLIGLNCAHLVTASMRSYTLLPIAIEHNLPVRKTVTLVYLVPVSRLISLSFSAFWLSSSVAILMPVSLTYAISGLFSDKITRVSLSSSSICICMHIRPSLPLRPLYVYVCIYVPPSLPRHPSISVLHSSTSIILTYKLPCQTPIHLHSDIKAEGGIDVTIFFACLFSLFSFFETRRKLHSFASVLQQFGPLEGAYYLLR
ncbi:hypothetical protein LguiA_020898 [Lonicera macranthoides]